jgi:light-regulated signal transduction histidine kinase (bacteriophytochrome)
MRLKADPRLLAIQDQIMALAAGDLSARGQTSEHGDELDAIVSGLNMLAEDVREREETRIAAERDRQKLAARSNELEKANEALREFAYVASHDLQEPLRMVASFTQLLAKHYGDQLDERARRYIGFAVDGAERMQSVIEALLDYSRVGEHTMKLTVCDTSVVVADLLLLLKPRLDELGATVDVGALPTVRADAVQLGRVFQNLVSNALKYRSDLPSHIRIRARHHRGVWQFEVQDNGIGIEPRHAERIFGIFQRLHTRDEYAGTGIGLAICRKVVEAHGGSIWVDSTPGEGSTFFFTLPLAGDS